MGKKSNLEIELMGIINQNSASEIEKVERYCSLVRISKNLDKSISSDGTMIRIMNGNQEFLKPNPAIAEKVKINAALIKLDEFFEGKRAQKSSNNELDFGEFT
ncbi:P27 family phage terminase small subunit [Lactococcus fujiensis]|nr:P27 family phage terminase small subunit [Lactococcus fujiensis]